LEIDMVNADEVRGELLSVLNQGAVLLIADMSKTTFCDSAGINALVHTFKRATAGAAGMRLVVGMPAVRRVFAITGVDRLISIYPSVGASLARPAAQRTLRATLPRMEPTGKGAPLRCLPLSWWRYRGA
jgi:anti-sigma B factor antagonist